MKARTDRATGLVLMTLGWAGCSSKTKTIADADPADGAIDVATDASADHAPADAGAPLPIAVTSPSFSVAMDSESTQCVVLDLGNDATIQIGEIKTTLSPVVYELRIAAVSGAPQPTPSPCTPFGDIGDPAARPLVFARNGNETLQFPKGVGYSLVPHQLLRFEIHVANVTAGALDATARATFVPAAAKLEREAGLLLLEAYDISVPAQAVATLGPTFFPLSTPIGSASVFRLMGYTHTLGVSVAIEAAKSAGDPSPVSIYAPSAWDPASPHIADLMPPAVLPSPGGMNLTCSWNNMTGMSALRGTSVNDERCVGVVSYYPAGTVHTCINTGPGAGTTLCCPGAAGCP